MTSLADVTKRKSCLLEQS